MYYPDTYSCGYVCVLLALLYDAVWTQFYDRIAVWSEVLLLVWSLVYVCVAEEEGEEGVAGVDACDFGVCGSEDEEDCWDLCTVSLYLCLEQVGF
jgi:hypothetical protein